MQGFAHYLFTIRLRRICRVRRYIYRITCNEIFTFKITDMKRIILLLMAGALLAGSAATAQNANRGERRMRQFEQRPGNEMHHEMHQMSRHKMKARQNGNCCMGQSLKVISYESKMVGEMVVLDFMINYDGLMLDPNEQFVVNPYIQKGEDKLWLQPVVMLGEKSFKALERGQELHGNISGLIPYQTVVMSRKYVSEMRREARRSDVKWMADSPNTVMYSASFPYQAWMDGAEIKLEHVFSNTRNIIAEYPTSIGTLYNPMPPQVMFIVPEVEMVKARSETMTSRIVFLVNKATIDTKIFNNATELDNIYNFTSRLWGDKKVKITGIKMTGYASPEGPYNLNAKLSLARVNTIKDLVQKKYPSIEKSLYTIANVPEDWDSVSRWVAASDIKYRSQVLDIIKNFDPDNRDARIRALDNGATYNMLLHDVYPGLRRTEYTIDYTVLPFTVEEGRKVIVTNPRYLSLNELYQIALTYPIDSPQYEEVFAIAVRYFPQDPVANNNMAAIALLKKDLPGAQKYLDKISDYAGAHNNMGVLKALEGDYPAAEMHFRKAMENGSKEAEFNLENLASLRSY